MGFNVRRYGEKLLIKPSKAAIKRHRERLAAEMKALRGANAAAVLQRLNPIIRGWSAYYRTVVSVQTFSGLDHYVWQLTYKWATHSHQNKPKRWVVARYFGEFHKSRRDRWVFGDRESGAYLLKHAWTNIVRHQMVPGRSSPDDPTLADSGPDGESTADPRWTASPWASFEPSTDAARPAVNFCSKPTKNHKPSLSGSSGWR